MRPRTRILILFAILLVAAAVRLVGLRFGLPFAYARPDETEAAGPAVTYLTTGSLRPQFFQWPSLFSYVVAALYALYGGVFGFLTGHASIAAFIESRYQAFAPFLLIPRAFSATMGVVTVAAVYTLARRVFNEVTGLTAAWLLAIAFLHVRDSHFGMSDVTMTALVVLSTLATVAWSERGGVGRALLAGLLVGLAGSTKYNGLAAGAPMAIALLLHLRDGRGIRPTLTAAIVFGLAVAAGFFGASPYILIDWSRFLTDVGSVQTTLATGHGGMQISRGWWYFGSVVLPAGLGWPVFIASVAGIAGLLVTRWRASVVLLAFPLAYYAYAGQSYSVFARYILPVVPYLCITAAWLVVALVGALVERSVPESARRAATSTVRAGNAPAFVSRSHGFTLATAALLVSAPGAWSVFQLDRLLSVTDNRVVSAHALATVLPADDLIYQSGSSYGRVPLGLNGGRFRTARGDVRCGCWHLLPGRTGVGARATLAAPHVQPRTRFADAHPRRPLHARLDLPGRGLNVTNNVTVAHLRPAGRLLSAARGVQRSTTSGPGVRALPSPLTMASRAIVRPRFAPRVELLTEPTGALTGCCSVC